MFNGKHLPTFMHLLRAFQVGHRSRIFLPMQETQERRVLSLRGGRSHGAGNGKPHQYSRPGNPKDRGVCQAIVDRTHTVGHDLATK